MVLTPLCNSSMMDYIWCEQINRYNLSGNVFGYSHEEKTQIYRFLHAAVYAPKCPDFCNKWSWCHCVIPIWWITYGVNKSTGITYLVMYLDNREEKNSNLSIFACLLVYAPKLHPAVSTIEINGHEASVLYQYDELHIMWTNWSI